MRAVVVRSHAAPEVLAVEELPTPQPGPGQVRVTTELTRGPEAARFPLGEAPAAHALVESRAAVGRVYLEPAAVTA